MSNVVTIAALCALPLAIACVPCGPPGGGGDAEAAGGGSCFGSAGQFATTPPAGAKCSTGAFWNGGDHGSSSMHPGVDCIACHSSGGEGPRYAIAGTVMGALDDADDCQGVSGVTVDVTDHDGQVHETTSNDAGNFFFDGQIPTPYTVTLTQNGKTRAMVAAQTSGTCLGCHTSTGANAAPGRIVAP